MINKTGTKAQIETLPNQSTDWFWWWVEWKQAKTTTLRAETSSFIVCCQIESSTGLWRLEAGRVSWHSDLSCLRLQRLPDDRRVTAKARFKSGVQMDAGSGSKSYISWQQRVQRGRCIIMVATACARWGSFHLWSQTSLDLKKSAVWLKGLRHCITILLLNTQKKSIVIFFF